MSAQTICRHLNEIKRYGRRPRKTPLLTQKHKKARLDFAKMYLRKPKSFWENILWTGTENGMRPTKKRTRYLQSNMVEVQRCFAASAMKSEDNQKILRCNVGSSVRKLGLRQRSLMFQKDKHTPNGTQKLLRTKRWRVLKWPAMTPVLNLIEHFWRVL